MYNIMFNKISFMPRIIQWVYASLCFSTSGFYLGLLCVETLELDKTVWKFLWWCLRCWMTYWRIYVELWAVSCQEFEENWQGWNGMHCPPQLARSMGPTWGPPGADRTQVGPMLAPWTLLSGSVQKDLLMCRPLHVIGFSQIPNFSHMVIAVF